MVNIRSYFFPRRWGCLGLLPRKITIAVATGRRSETGLRGLRLPLRRESRTSGVAASALENFLSVKKHAHC